MAKTACKCKKPAECEECPEWIFTFADLVMLMMGFFVILWVLKPPAGNPGTSAAQTDEAQRHWEQVVGEIRKGFGYEPNPHSNDPIDQAMIQRARGMKNGAENEHPRDTPLGTDHDPTSVRPGNQNVIGAAILFDRGQSKLTPQTTKLLDDLAERIRGHFTIIYVKGHTAHDDFDDATSGQKMELSLLRAEVVRDYLISKGVSDNVLRVLGCSDAEPVREREYTPGGLALNRRVEVEWTSQLAEERQDQSNRPAKPLDERPVATTRPASIRATASSE